MFVFGRIRSFCVLYIYFPIYKKKKRTHNRNSLCKLYKSMQGWNRFLSGTNFYYQTKIEDKQERCARLLCCYRGYVKSQQNSVAKMGAPPNVVMDMVCCCAETAGGWEQWDQNETLVSEAKSKFTQSNKDNNQRRSSISPWHIPTRTGFRSHAMSGPGDCRSSLPLTYTDTDNTKQSTIACRRGKQMRNIYFPVSPSS